MVELVALTSEFTEPIKLLARDCGVILNYVDDHGQPRDADLDVVSAVLTSLGIDADKTYAAETLAYRREDQHRRLIEPVVVLDADRAPIVPVRLSTGRSSLMGLLTTEHGEQHEFKVTVNDLRHTSSELGWMTLPTPLRPGYHQLDLDDGTTQSSSMLLVRPGHRDLDPSSTWRGLGITAPLFSLHAQSSFGVGDIGVLDRLAASTSDAGVGVIATLPLLAGFSSHPFEPSPYLPVSRRFWHERWIDLDEAVTLCSPGVTSEIFHKTLRNPSTSDVEAVLAAKRVVLNGLANAVDESDGYLSVAFEEFCARSPEVMDYARFRAAGERYGLDWRGWPAAVRLKPLEPTVVDPEVERYYAFTQWLANDQMSALSTRLEARGQVLGLDLPLGVHPFGYDIYADEDQFAHGLSVGAPPDISFPHGQRWGFPPLRPDAARLDGHGIFRRSLAHHLNIAAMLRIDHALGLQRLFVIPDGADVSDGVYLESRTKELLAVLAIESQRHGADIVGEDLGTVDPSLPQLLEREGIRRTYVAELNVNDHGSNVLEAPPVGSVASFSTHDLPPFAAWWSMRDLDERVELGLLDVGEAALLSQGRAIERTRLWSLSRDVDEETPSSEAPMEVLDAVHADLASSEAGLVMLQLHDLLGESQSVNLPGTSTERANWIQLSSKSIDEIESDATLTKRLTALHQLRSAARSTVHPSHGEHPGVVSGVTRLDAVDDHLFNEGRHFRLYEKLGSHQMTVEGEPGTYFAVWAPNAARVEVVGDFNEWNGSSHALNPHNDTGIFEGFIVGVGPAERYKYRITSDRSGAVVDKADPLALHAEIAPKTASITAELSYAWQDGTWMAKRNDERLRDEPMAVYEVHLGSWRRVPEEADRMLSYRELAPYLIEYLSAHGFTHVEFLPIAEHPFYASWGYQPTGFFAPTSRYGGPDDFAYLIDQLHLAGIGVFVDWVPAHFPSDDFALSLFDGTHLYEHADERQRIHPDWGSLVFNYGRNEVRSFLISSACSFLDRFHVDGLRFDAVASMLYLDYSREPGMWIPNRFGGRENLEAIEFLRACNDEVHRSFSGVITVAEESTAWPGVTTSTAEGGLGFDYKWDLGWMHDTLGYLGRESVHRHWHQDELTFRAIYQGTEHYLLPLSHDEVVHGKGSLLGQMAGDSWQRFANLRLLFGLQYAQPGKKLLFMGGEFAQESEWSHDDSIDWHLLEQPEHQGILSLVTELNALYREHPALHSDGLDDDGFRIISADASQSVFCIERHDDKDEHLVFCVNATPVPRQRYRVGMPSEGPWKLLMNSDDERYGGSGMEITHTVTAESIAFHGYAASAELDLPPLGFVLFGTSA